MRTTLPARRRQRQRRAKTGVVGLLVAALVAGMGALGASAALAAPPEVTFTLEAVDQASGAPIPEVAAGADFTVTASVGCPDPAGCGPATLTVVFPEHIEFLAGGFTPPNGATVAVDPPEAGTARTVTLTWEELSGTAVVFLPARVLASVAADQNGVAQMTAGALVAGADEDLITLEDDTTVTLRVYEQPGIDGGSLTWSTDSFSEGSQAEAIETVTGIANANSVSSLRFAVPNGATIPGASLPTSEAFDLETLTLNQNPGGAEVEFTLANGEIVRRAIGAEELSIEVPPETIGYTVTVSGMPSRATTEAPERTVTVTAGYRLRDVTRTTGERIIQVSQDYRMVRSTANIANLIGDPAPGAPALNDRDLTRDVRVSALAPSISNELTWETASGDATSVYGSGEASTLNLRFSNAGGPTLSEVTFDLTPQRGKFFEFQELTEVPSIAFPEGAVRATIRYNYATDPQRGEAHEFVPGSATPGPDADGRDLGEVSGVTVQFFASEGDAIQGGCALADDCAGLIQLTGVLRDAELTSGNPIVPSPNANTRVEMRARITATATTGAKFSGETAQARLTLVKPQVDVKLSKRFGDGTGKVVYPLTGVAQTGDIFDPSKDPQDFADHALRFVASTSPSEGATEKPGATSLTITDPQVTPTVNNLGNNPFNTIKFTQLPVAAAGDAVCTTSDDSPVASTTTQQVWVLDPSATPQTISLVPYTEEIDLEWVVGVEMTITPVGDTRFPLDVSCASAEGSTVSFRDIQISTGLPVSPATVGSAETPGLLAIGNTAELTTGTNTGSATGSDSLYLVDLDSTSIHKDFAEDAEPYGVQGQDSPTSFVLSAVPANSTSTAGRIIDGNSVGDSFDVFALAGVRDARLGPDQQMRITFRDMDGTEIGPVGTVDASISIEDGDLTEEEIEDSQSAGYREFQGTAREIDWSDDWEEGEKSAVYSVRVDVTRSDNTEALQLYGAFSAVLDVTLRDTYLNQPTETVIGSLAGIEYENRARVFSRSAEGEWSDAVDSVATFIVFAVDRLLGEASVTWKAYDSLGRPEQNDYLVAKHQSASRVTINAANKSAAGVIGVDPENQWSATGSLAVGLETLSAGVGGTATSGLNPFAITDFTGLVEVRWPERVDAKPGETDAQRRVAGVIMYEYADGSDQLVPAPVGAPLENLNPPRERWANVVSVKIRWSEPDKFIGVKRDNSEVHGRVSFNTELRDYVRAGYRYTFSEGVPGTLESGESIDGPAQSAGGPGRQIAELPVAYRAELAGYESVTGSPQRASMPIEVANSTVDVNLDITRNSSISRDPIKTGGQDTRWLLRTQNTGNIPVSSLKLATESALLDGDWSAGETATEPDLAGTAFDAMSITRVRLTYPEGAERAMLWARGEDGSWTQAIAAGHNTDVALPESGSGPRSWAEVTGLRVQFEGDESERKRIMKRATGTVEFDTRLRDHLRSAPGEIAPAALLPAGEQNWVLPQSGAGAAYLANSGDPLSSVTDVRNRVTVEPGAPQPLVRKYAANYNQSTNTGDTSTTANPGSWVNFTVVLENQGNATSDLSDLEAIDTLPDDLLYNAVNESVAWRVVSAPEGVSKTPEMRFEQTGVTTMRWAWPAGQKLKPGERIVIRVPLQVRDGMGAGTAGQNTARIIGVGIPDAPTASVCLDEESLNRSCVATANAIALRSDSVRAEAYLDATIGGASTVEGDTCDVTTTADWEDGTWVRNPCIVETTVGSTLKYRVKLINSGNSELTQLRFVDQLPALNDQGAVLDAARGSEWTPELVPGSVELVTGEAAEALGARGDGTLTNAGLRFTDTAKACTLKPDAYAGQNTLACDSGSWGAEDSSNERAFGGDIAFAPEAKLSGGDYVLVDFEMTVPPTGEVPEVAWNTAAVAGQVTPVSSWLPASESSRSGARAQDASMLLTLDLEDGPATPWHLGAESYDVTLSCLTPGSTTPQPRRFTLPGIDTVDGQSQIVIAGLPRGGTCEVTDVIYDPSTPTADGQYGAAASGTTGFSFRADPAEGLLLDDDVRKNTLAVTNVFSEATVALGVDVDGDAAAVIPEDATFETDMSCSFGGITQTFGTFAVPDGGAETVEGLPVGVECEATETDARGATSVTATLNGQPAELNEDRRTTLETLDPGAHEVRFLNTFTAGGDLTVLKTVETPRADTVVGDAGFDISCTLGGYDLALGDRAALGLSFAPGQKQVAGSIPGLPTGAECTVHESVTGGANVAAPDRTVTTLPEDEVIVEMVNTFNPATLEIDKRVTGAGADEARVPGAFDVQASCTRELTIGGEARTVTDHSAVTSVAPGNPALITDLPEGSQCAVTEPDVAGAERTTVESVTAGIVDEDAAPDAALVTLRGPDAAGAALPTEVRVTNEYDRTPVGPGGPDGPAWLSVTGGAAGLFGAAALLLLLGAAALLGRQRRNRV